MHRAVSMRTATEPLSLQAEAVRDGRGLCSKLQAKRQEDVVQRLGILFKEEAYR